MRITLAQINPVIGDFTGNLSRMETAIEKAVADNADLIVFPELIPSGYPPKDALERKDFLHRYAKADSALLQRSENCPELAILYGTIEETQAETGKPLYNTARLIQNGTILFRQYKTLLPTYDVFDEDRYFQSATAPQLFTLNGVKLGISICEDAWNATEVKAAHRYDLDPVARLGQLGAQLFINISASPFALGKEETRIRLARAHAKRHGIPFILVNQVGANDELISDGRSLAVDSKGELRVLFPAFQTHVETVDTTDFPPIFKYNPAPAESAAYEALTLGIQDYIEKCGFKSVVLGLSGGVDSALTCCLAAKALGPDNVHAVYMPSPFSANASGEDAEALARNLGVHFSIIPINEIFKTYHSMMQPHFQGLPENEAEENFQARIRGNLLMGLSNKFGHLCLASGNKSELSVGYCTLYGDMSGGLSVIGDVPKTLVYRICDFINRDKEIIPQRILTRAPSAELKPDQTDQDTLPPYDILDAILDRYLEKGLPAEAIIEEGFESEIVHWIIKTVRRNEYKRNQAAPSLKITGKAFGSGRRIPIAARWT